MVDGATSLHDFDDSRFNLVDSEVLYLLLDTGSFFVLSLLADHDWYLVAEQWTLVITVNCQDILGCEGMGSWSLQQKLAFYQRDQVLLQVLNWYLSNLKHILVANLSIFIEQHKQEHLVARCQKLIPLIKVASQLSWPQAQLPMNLSSVIELREVELRERRHRICYLFWKRDQLGNWLLSILWPMPLRKDLHVKLQWQCLTRRFSLEFASKLLRHFDVLKHHFKLLRKLEPTFLFKLQNKCALCILVVMPVI